jgi:hypothetical protein
MLCSGKGELFDRGLLRSTTPLLLKQALVSQLDSALSKQLFMEGTVYGMVGKAKEKTDPLTRLLVTLSEPPYASTIVFAIGKSHSRSMDNVTLVLPAIPLIKNQVLFVTVDPGAPIGHVDHNEISADLNWFLGWQIFACIFKQVRQSLSDKTQVRMDRWQQKALLDSVIHELRTPRRHSPQVPGSTAQSTAPLKLIDICERQARQPLPVPTASGSPKHRVAACP